MLDGFVPWPVSLKQDYVKQKYWKNLTIGEMFDSSARHFSHREVLVYKDLRLTYAELKTKVDRLSDNLVSAGFRAQDIVVVQLGNIPEFIYAYFAFAKIGVIPVMCLPQHRGHEIRHIMNLVGARGYLFPGNAHKFDYLALGLRLKEEVEGLEFLLSAGGNVPAGALSINDLSDSSAGFQGVSANSGSSKPDASDVALFLLSGGTTGMPKVIPRTHNDYLYNSETSGTIAGLNMHSVFLATTPLPHNFALASPGVQAVVQKGGKIVIPPSHRPVDVLRCVEQEGVTYVPAVPPMIISWLNYPEVGEYDLRSWEVVINGGAKLTPEVAERVRPTLGCQLQQIFGMAEGLLVMTELDDPDDVVCETVGRPISPGDEVEIVDDEENLLSAGEAGEMICRGPYTIRGYFNAPEHNAKAFTDEGFFKSGDVMRIREDGRLVVEGRKKDLINRGGEKINAEEVENVILSHPDVQNAAVIAMPDPVMGERTCAYVILKPGKELTLEGLSRFMLEKEIAKFKLPERLEGVEEFPLTNVGKVSKKDLRKDVEARLAEYGNES